MPDIITSAPDLPEFANRTVADTRMKEASPVLPVAGVLGVEEFADERDKLDFQSILPSARYKRWRMVRASDSAMRSDP